MVSMHVITVCSVAWVAAEASFPRLEDFLIFVDVLLLKAFHRVELLAPRPTPAFGGVLELAC